MNYKDVQYLINKADGVKKGRLDAGGRYQQQNVAAVEVSYLVALRIAIAKKPHTIDEDLLLPATKDIVTMYLSLLLYPYFYCIQCISKTLYSLSRVVLTPMRKIKLNISMISASRLVPIHIKTES